MSIYSKTGDKGETSLLGGKRVSKSHVRIEAYGTLDELISHIGLLRDQKVTENIRSDLIEIQNKLMVCAALLAAGESGSAPDLPKLTEKDVSYLENLIDEMDEKLEQLSSFILPGGHSAVSICHIARNVCRRGERNIVRLDEHEGVPSVVIMYMNRLSDFLFVLARKISKDLGIQEKLWDTRG